VNLKSELEAGWALRAGQQATALKEAHAKVAALEKSLQQVSGQGLGLAFHGCWWQVLHTTCVDHAHQVP